MILKAERIGRMNMSLRDDPRESFQLSFLSRIGFLARAVAHEAQQLVILLLIILLVMVFSSVQPAFLSAASLDNIFRMCSIFGISALGMTLIIITGGIDLSVGSVMALGGALGAGLLGTAYGAANPIHLPFSVAFIVALLISGAIGFLNGWAITTLNMTPFVVTLGMMTLVRGLTYIYTDFTVRAIPGSPITFSDPGFDWLGSGNVGFLPTQTLIFLVLAVIMVLMTRFSPFGRDVYAIGGSLEIARLAGIKTGRVTIGAYTIMAMLAGLSGIMLAGRLSSVAPSMATGYELNVITIVVVGGASLSGGRGSILGTVLGALMITMIDSGLDLLNVPSFYQYLVRGTVLLAAVIIDKWCRGRQMTSATG